MTAWTRDEALALRRRDWIREMTATPGWEALAKWMQERIDDEIRALEYGVTDWGEYQLHVGGLRVLREVLGKPGELVEEADELERGDIDG